MKKMFLLAASSALVLAACGDETTNVTEVTESTGMDIIAKGEKMPACDKENAGKMIFVTDSSAVFYCADEKWTTLNGKDGENGKPGTSADAKNGTSCTAKEVKDGIEVSCGGEVIGTIKNGTPGASSQGCSAKEVEEGLEISCEGKVVGLIKNGEDGRDLVAVYDTVTTDFLNQDMLKDGKYGILVDKRDNKVYRTIEIGTQTWLAQNLDYSDGGLLSYCYDNDPKQCKKFGRLYYWAEANNLDNIYNYQMAAKANTSLDSIIRYPSYGICPDGWFIPDSSDWTKLKEWVIANNTVFNNNEGFGTSLKSAVSEAGWKEYEGVETGTDRYGFSAVPTGILLRSGIKFQEYGEISQWWSSREEASVDQKTDAVVFALYYKTNLQHSNPIGRKVTARSIRCLKK